MSESGWTPIHHVEAEDPEVEQSPAGEKPAGEPKAGGERKAGETKAAVTLTLALPDDFTKAVVKAIEANTKAVQALKALLDQTAKIGASE